MNKEEICMSEDLEDKIVIGTVKEQIVLTRDNCKELLEYINNLQKKAELGDHYKHLYSELKKQKDDVVEYIKYQISNLDFKKDEDMKAKMLGSMILVMLEDNRMLGEIDVED